MKTTAFPDPPNPADLQYKDQKAYNLAQYRWASQMKSELQGKGRVNERAVATNFVPTHFTTATTITGTDTLGNVANVLCTLIQALINKGTLKTNITNQ